MNDVILHHLDESRSHRILWLLEELGVPYELKLYQRNAGRRAPSSLEDVHPLGKSPVVEIDGEVFAESGAIVEELLDRFDPDHRLHPPHGTPEHKRHRYWLHFAEGSLMPPLLIKLLTTMLRKPPVPKWIRPVVAVIPGAVASALDSAFTDAELDKLAAFLDAELTGRTWLVGDDLTAADIQVAFPVIAGRERLGDRVPIPAVEAWIARCQARPAYQRAVDKGGPPA